MKCKNLSVGVLIIIFVYTIIPAIPAQMNGTHINDRVSYFKQIRKLVETHFYYKDTIAQRNYFHTYEKRFLQSKDDESAYVVLKEMMHTLPGAHSGFATPAEAVAVVAPGTPEYPSGSIVEKNIAFIKVPSCMLGETLAIMYVDSMRSLVKKLQITQPAGWIIDLRMNNGGSSPAMLAALQSFFEGTTVYYSKARNGVVNTHQVERGMYKQLKGGKLAYSFSGTMPAATSRIQAPIAVLTGKQTGSAGEILTIAFKSLPNARTFGVPTAGVPTGNLSFVLEDGAMVYITTSITYDVHHVEQTGPIHPDVMVNASQGDDAFLSPAIKWIRTYVGKN